MRITPALAALLTSALVTLAPLPAPAQPVSSDTAVARAVPWYLRYRWNGVNVWAGGAVSTRTASHNELFAGSMRIVGMQLSRDVWRSGRSRLSYVGEVLPAILVNSGAPYKRLQNILTDPAAKDNPARVQRYYRHESYGFGLAPFGAEYSARVAGHINALVHVTAGAALFTHVVPYGDATKANFTVSPGAALQWNGLNRVGIAAGYTLHHLSNASFGAANPGMNSHIFYVRLGHLRHGS